MISKQIIIVIGLELTVYGLEEYNQLPKGTPVSIMFAFHGRLENQTKMESIAHSLCELNERRKKQDAHLIVVTFDSANHGTRLNHKLANFAWFEGKYRNPNHTLDMWTMMYSTSRTVSELIDVIEYYLFGPRPQSIVNQWGVIGFSMGGTSAFIAGADDPRISVVIPIAGMANFLGLMESRVNEFELPADVYLPKPFYDLVYKKTFNIDQKLKEKHILIMNGEDDVLVKPEYNQPLIDSLRKIHVGKEGRDWRYDLVPGVGHGWCPEMVEASVQWTYRWMVQNQ